MASALNVATESYTRVLSRGYDAAVLGSLGEHIAPLLAAADDEDVLGGSGVAATVVGHTPVCLAGEVTEVSCPN